MKIAIIGSGSYIELMMKHKGDMEVEGHWVKMPVFDSQPGWDELKIVTYNKELIKWSDRVDLIWDSRSIGTWGDFCMAFALDKPVKIVYLNQKTIIGVVQRYAEKWVKP